MQIFAALPVYIGGPLFIGVFVAFGIVAGLVVHRVVPSAVFDEHNDIAGFMFAVVGVVYAVLLAFLAIAVWERYEAAEVRTFDEANQLAVVYRAVDVFPQAPKIRRDLMRYTTLVINDEWPKMDGAGESSEANLLLERIGYDIRHLRANTPSQQAVLSSLLENIHSIMVDRDYRISMSSEGINTFVWAILFAGAIGTMLFACLFAFKRASAQVAMTGLLAFSLAIVLYLISVMDYPFRGEVRIGPEAFVTAAHTYCDVGC